MPSGKITKNQRARERRQQQNNKAKGKEWTQHKISFAFKEKEAQETDPKRHAPAWYRARTRILKMTCLQAI